MEEFNLSQQHSDHPPYFLEQDMSRAVAAGDRDSAHKAVKAHRAFQQPRLAKDAVRSAKNMTICMFTLLARAAISGGVAPESAFLLSDRYILELEECTTVEDVYLTSNAALDAFLNLVRSVQAKQFSAPVSETMQYINMHLTDRLTLPQLAQRVHLHPNYLSSIFKRETGESVTNYILRSRIHEAALMLRGTQHSASEIARIFGFCNQSYFIKTFRRYMDCSPQQYRDGAAVDET